MLPVKAGNDIDCRKTAAELRNDLWQKVDGGTNRQRYANAFGVFCAEILPLLNGGFQLSVKRAQRANELGACRGEHSAFAGALKDSKPNFVLHYLYLIGQCGLRDKEIFGCTVEIQHLRQFQDIFHLLGIHW